MNLAPASDRSADSVDAAVLRLEEYQDEIIRTLEHAGLSESRLDEISQIVSELAMEMYSRGRLSCCTDSRQN